MISPATLPVPIVGINADRHTLGQLRAAARAIGDDGLFLRTLQGDQLASDTLGRFLSGDLERIA